MAHLTTNFNQHILVNNQFNQYANLSINYTNLYAGQFDFDYSGVSYSEESDSLIVDYMQNGDTFTYRGLNLLQDYSTLTEFLYQSNQFSFLALGLIDFNYVDDQSSGGFYLIKIDDLMQNGSPVTYTYTGNFGESFNIINSFDISFNGFNFNFSGHIDQDEFGVLSGNISQININSGNSSSVFTGLNVDFNTLNSVNSYSELLSVVLSGDDRIEGSSGNDLIDGSTGNDTVVYGMNKSNISNIIKLSDNSYQLSFVGESDELINIENIEFANGETINLSDLYHQVNDDSDQIIISANGLSERLFSPVYEGPVAGIDYQVVLGANNDVVVGSSKNDFINLGAGDDAVEGGSGNDVLDGGIGSNFLTGGFGEDVFFLDGRGGSTTWATVTDFTKGEQINIWGWQEGVSKMLFQLEDQGAEGFKGATFHYDLNNDGAIDTSITLSGLSLNDVESSAKEVAGNGYLLIN